MTEFTAAIDVSHLKKSYKKVQVLQDVSFTVEKGSIFALLGANGAGKTTTINILTTLIKADGGRAVVNGNEAGLEPRKIRESISLTGQFAAVDDILTARENLTLIAELRHELEPAQTARTLLEQFDLTAAADRRVGTFSGGMRRRLDIAMSLIGKPAIIFFDEPTTGLDPESRNMMWEHIRSLAQSGTTIFLTTQYLEEADQLADRIAILAKGRIVAEGTPSELKKLVPGGKMEFTFHSKAVLDHAIAAFHDYEATPDADNYKLTVTTDGSAKHVAQLLTKIESAKIELAEFSQKTPTLDDVFLKIITETKEKK